MGKTAVARIIALAQLSQGWQAVDCRNPNDFFSSLQSGERQVFVADDAFGRTEYNPMLGREWERDLAAVLSRVDRRHWLIWTTRRHILARALRDMDLPPRARKFPEPGEVVVSADELTIQDKARMLYRHARVSAQGDALRTLVRANARRIVQSPYFTPERIRRFVTERLPVLADMAQNGQLNDRGVAAEVLEAIRDPTRQMRLAFQKLPALHQWILLSLLESPANLFSQVGKRVEGLSARAFSESLDDLVGTFVWSQHQPWFKVDVIDWIHPSYRDLIIDELGADVERQEAFLIHTTVDGLQLALSECGGDSGGRMLPLVGCERSWQALRTRALAMAADEDEATVRALVGSLAEALRIRGLAPSSSMVVAQILRDVCELVRERWDSADESLEPETLRAYDRAAGLLEPRPKAPSVITSWETWSERLRDMLESGHLDVGVMRTWTDMANLVIEAGEELASTDEFRAQHEGLTSGLFDALEYESDHVSISEDPEENDEFGSRLNSLADAIRGFSAVPTTEGRSIIDLAKHLEAAAQSYFEEGSPPEPDTEYDSGRSSDAGLDIEAMFSDL